MLNLFNKPAKTTVLAPDFESVVMPGDADMPMALKIESNTLLDARVADHFILRAKQRFLQLRQPDGKPYLDQLVDGALKRFYIFALPKMPGSTAYRDDPNYMVAVQCAVTQPVPNTFSVMPEKLFRGPEVYFVMSASFACCGGGRRARAMLYSDISKSEGPFLNIGFAGDGMRPEIRSVWQNLQVVNLNGAGAAVLAHLAQDLTGTCTNHAALPNPGKSTNWTGSAPRL